VAARICSLVPAATEVLFALGLGDQVVAVTHECDWPPAARKRPAITSSRLDPGALTSAEIDRRVREAAEKGEALYAVDEALWRKLRPDVVVAQELCEVCAVSAGSVRRLEARVVDYSPTTLDGVATAIAELGERLGARGAGQVLAGALRGRVERMRAAVSGRPRPRVFVAEWLDPPFAAGHWVPEMVDAAGGVDVAGRAGTPSFRTTWERVASLRPDVVVLAPCGFDLKRTLAEAPAALPGATVAAVDANGYFSRPGPRLADGVELLAHLLHPEVVPACEARQAAVRLEATVQA
jgi:iron complex transport system substrate-binding protein